MNRQFTTIADAAPHMFHFGDGSDEFMPTFTAAETAQLMMMYAQAHIDARCGSSINKKFGRLKCVEIEAKMAEWEKSNRGPHA